MATKRGSKSKTGTKVNDSGPSTAEYKMVKSIESDSLNYVTTRMTETVTIEMADGWLPHGTPVTLIEDGKYIMVQAMVRGIN